MDWAATGILRFYVNWKWGLKGRGIQLVAICKLTVRCQNHSPVIETNNTLRLMPMLMLNDFENLAKCSCGRILFWRYWPDLEHLILSDLTPFSWTHLVVCLRAVIWTQSDCRGTYSVFGLPAAHNSYPNYWFHTLPACDTAAGLHSVRPCLRLLFVEEGVGIFPYL